MSFFDLLLRRATEKKLFSLSDKIIIGLSGGPDSVFLFHFLSRMRDIIGFCFTAAHVNHQLRGKDSQSDEDFVRSLCDSFGISLSVLKADIKVLAKEKKQSIEMCARDVRYGFFINESQKTGANIITTAHTADDRIETALLRLISGSSLSGITGLRFSRLLGGVSVTRPLLNVWKKDILEYLGSNGIEYRLDKSNSSLDFTRNKVRNLLIPYIESNFNPSFKSTFYNTLDLLTDQALVVEGSVLGKLNTAMIRQDHISVFYKPDLMRFNPSLASGLLSNSMRHLAGDRFRVSSVNFRQLIGLFCQSGTRVFQFPLGIRAVSDKFYVFILRKDDLCQFVNPIKYKRQEVIPFEIEINDNPLININVSVKEYEHERFCDISNTDNQLWHNLLSGRRVVLKSLIPLDNGVKKVVVRNRAEGDRVKLKSGTKKVKDFFIECAIPSILRNTLPLIESDGKIIWLPCSDKLIDYNPDNTKKMVVEVSIKI